MPEEWVIPLSVARQAIRLKPQRAHPLRPMSAPFITDGESASHMQRMHVLNSAAAKNNSNELWAADSLNSTGLKWKRQAIWGYRIFDFWNGNLGCAVEIDGPEHDPAYDAYRDEYNFRRSGVVVLRVRNGNKDDLERAIALIAKLPSLANRKVQLRIIGNTKQQRRRLSAQAYHPLDSMLQRYLASL